MILTKTNKYNSLEKSRAILLSFFYIFLLFVTTFHHHPIDLGEKHNFITKHNNESSPFHYTSEECPIVNFSATGFNSYSISPSYEIITHSVKQLISYDYTYLYNSKNIYLNPLRGPPSSFA